jgi:hypothetical protein
MQSQKWGPHSWEFLHSVTFSFPLEPSDTDKENYKNFFTSIQFILPCSFCRSYYSILLKYIAIDCYLDSRHGIVFWLFIIHNLINKKLNYPLQNFKYVMLKYENLRARCKPITVTVTESDVYHDIIYIYKTYHKIARSQLQKLYLSCDIIDDDLHAH